MNCSPPGSSVYSNIKYILKNKLEKKKNIDKKQKTNVQGVSLLKVVKETLLPKVMHEQ